MKKVRPFFRVEIGASEKSADVKKYVTKKIVIYLTKFDKKP